MATFPFLLLRVRPASIRHNFPRQGNILPIKTTNSAASRNRIDTLRVEDEQSTINLWPLKKNFFYLLSTSLYLLILLFYFWLYISKFLFISISLNKAKYIFFVRFFTFVKILFSVKLKRLFFCYNINIYLFCFRLS